MLLLTVFARFLSLLECSVLTWHPAGDVSITCMSQGHSSSQGLVRSLLVTGTVLESTAGIFLQIRSDLDIFANTVRS